MQRPVCSGCLLRISIIHLEIEECGFYLNSTQYGNLNLIYKFLIRPLAPELGNYPFRLCPCQFAAHLSLQCPLAKPPNLAAKNTSTHEPTDGDSVTAAWVLHGPDPQPPKVELHSPAPLCVHISYNSLPSPSPQAPRFRNPVNPS